MLLFLLVDQKRLHHLQSFWNPDWNESPGVNAEWMGQLHSDQAIRAGGHLEMPNAADWRNCQTPKTQDFLNINNVHEYASISLNKLNKTFEQASRVHRSRKNTILWSQKMGSLCWLAVWLSANHFNLSGPQCLQLLNINYFPCHLHKVALYGIIKDTIQV